MNISTKNWQISRRHVLRGLGASIALPALNCMQPLSAASGGNALKQPKRSVFIYVPNGVNTLAWQIQKAGKDFEFTKPMAALERHRQNVTPISGLHHPNGIGKHHNCDKIWLTAEKITADGGAFRNSVSVDQLMAEVHGVHTRFPSLELTVTGGSLAWSRDGIPLPAERRPKEIFNRLFGEEQGGVVAARRRLNRRASVLDLVIDDAKSLRRKIGTEDRTKLDEYLTSVREVELRTERADSWLDVPKPSIDAKTKAHLTRNIPNTDAGDYYRTIYDMMVIAIRTDMTRVITCMSGNEGNGLAIPEIGVSQTRHELSHHNGDPEQIRRLTECDTFLVEQFAYLLDQLESFKEDDQTLLDSTQVLFGSGMSYGHSHGNANLPMVLAGGKSLGLQHGQHIDYNLPKIEKYDVENPGNHYRVCSRPVDSDAHLTNLLLTMLHRMDVEVDSFKDSNRTIDELLG
jgi:hypothetical protein